MVPPHGRIALDVEMGNKKSKQRWFVLLGAHVSLFLCAGINRSFGIFLVEWKRYFQTSSAEVSAILSILSASFRLAGGVAGGLCNKYGCHKVVILGACIAICGIIASVFAPNPATLCFTTGVCAAAGLGIIYNSATVVVAHHFKKSYSRANGVANSGIAVGMVVLSPLFQFLIDGYGWRGTLLILAAMEGNVIVCGLLFWPRWVRTAAATTNSSDSHNAELDIKSETLEDSTLMPSLKNDDLHCSCDQVTENSLNKLQNQSDATLFETRCLMSSANVSHDASIRRDAEVGINNTTPPRQRVNPTKLNPDDPQDSCKCSHDESQMNSPDNVSIVPSKEGPDVQQSCFNRFLKVSGLRLLGESVGFASVAIVQITLGVCYTAIIAHFVASAVYEGIDEQSAAFLLSVLGIASFVSRLSVGWIVDTKLISPIHLYMLAMTICGGSTILSRAANSYGWYVFIAVLLGASTGLLKSLLAIVLRGYVGVQNLAPALGVTMIFQGVGDLLGPVFAGALYDGTGSYDLPFFVAGSILIASTALFLFEPLLRHCRGKTETQPDESRKAVPI